MKRDVGDRLLPRQFRDAVDRKAADGERRLVDVREDVVEPLADADVSVRRVPKVLRDPRVEVAEARAGAKESRADDRVARGEEGFRRRRGSLGAGKAGDEAKNDAGAV